MKRNTESTNFEKAIIEVVDSFVKTKPFSHQELLNAIALNSKMLSTPTDIDNVIQKLVLKDVIEIASQKEFGENVYLKK